VAILGGLAGGALREVLKYRTVQKAVLVGVDRAIIETCREHIPEMTNCSWESAIGNTELVTITLRFW
jgi:spermidine synthase